MNNIFVYCEVEKENDLFKISDVSLELLSKGKKLAVEAKVALEAIILGGDNIDLSEIFKYGVDIIHRGEDSLLFPYETETHTKIIKTILTSEKPDIFLIGATSIGRDLGPRVASSLKVGLTADCTELEYGDYKDYKAGKTYQNLLYQIRPAFGGNIIATIVNPETKPQMATVREGVMKCEKFSEHHTGEIKSIDIQQILQNFTPAVKVIERHMEAKKVNLTGAQIIIAGGYGVGSVSGFEKLFHFAKIIGAEVGASRAAIDAGFTSHDRQIGQTGVTVRPKLYIAVGISGAIQHTSGMDNASQIISINTDPEAPINEIADYAICGDFNYVLDEMEKYFKEFSK